MGEIKRYQLDTKFTELKDYCHLANPNDFIEVTEWFNGEGFDVKISFCGGHKMFSLTNGEFEALTVLINMR